MKSIELIKAIQIIDLIGGDIETLIKRVDKFKELYENKYEDCKKTDYTYKLEKKYFNSVFHPDYINLNGICLMVDVYLEENKFVDLVKQKSCYPCLFLSLCDRENDLQDDNAIINKFKELLNTEELTMDLIVDNVIKSIELIIDNRKKIMW